MSLYVIFVSRGSLHEMLLGTFPPFFVVCKMERANCDESRLSPLFFPEGAEPLGVAILFIMSKNALENCVNASEAQLQDVGRGSSMCNARVGIRGVDTALALDGR